MGNNELFISEQQIPVGSMLAYGSPRAPV